MAIGRDDVPVALAGPDRGLLDGLIGILCSSNSGSRSFALRIPGADPQLRFNVRALRPISSNIYQEGAPEALRCGSAPGIQLFASTAPISPYRVRAHESATAREQEFGVVRHRARLTVVATEVMSQATRAACAGYPVVRRCRHWFRRPVHSAAPRERPPDRHSKRSVARRGR